jgi:hypothetical protein
MARQTGQGGGATPPAKGEVRAEVPRASEVFSTFVRELQRIDAARRKGVRTTRSSGRRG